ncbi:MULTISPECIES: hypothetical protein [Streptomyces]|uniref:Uncharacterized protein n=1 Tax=Streptomyces nymphaeiformis TaxID=2663842 RepID=A0A7W7U4B8_9ACTN|nr:hypothetical protein [Streptomyces nymphaeiformis]MBB4984803.1 hypothetical protein [Streptomyces nymphaeiformis]
MSVTRASSVLSHPQRRTADRKAARAASASTAGSSSGGTGWAARPSGSSRPV